MRAFLHKMRTLIEVDYASMLEYRAEILLWVLANATPFILMGAWTKAAASVDIGYTPADMVRYFLVMFLVRQWSMVWVIWEFEEQVVEGKLSFLLLQPFDPQWRHVANHIAERFARLPFVFALVAFVFWLYPQAWLAPGWAELCAFFLAATGALVLRFFLQFLLAQASFWTERAAALEEAWYMFYLFLSGMLAPMDLFPPEMATLANYTPFPSLISFPVSILMGKPVDLVQGFALQAMWILVFFALGRLAWRAGLRHYSGMGA